MRKLLVILAGIIHTPPMTTEARIEAGRLLTRVQYGDIPPMPHSRPIPTIGPRCHELRIQDRDHTWRIIYRTDADAVVVAEVFSKQTQRTPLQVIRNCQVRYAEYDRIVRTNQ